jgi:predicted nucleotidyltransferase
MKTQRMWDETEDLAGLLELIERPYIALMLYGSYARGDQLSGSDLDVLQLVESRRESYQKGSLSVSVYTESQLRHLAETGNLFVLHLRTEGKMLSDSEGRLQRSLASYRKPSNYRGLRSDISRAAAILDVDRKTFDMYAGSLSRLALYLLRTELYIRCAEQDNPAFSMREVGARLSDQRIVRCFAARLYETGRYEFFLDVRHLCEEYLQIDIHNEFESIEALAVNTYNEFPFVSRLALRVLAGDSSLDYQNLFPESDAP